MSKCAKCGKSLFLKWWDMPDGTKVCESCYDSRSTKSNADYIVQENIFDKCPVCQTGKVQNIKPTGLFGFAKSDKIACEHCQAIFIEYGMTEGEKAYRLDLSESQKQYKYDGQTLKKSEWMRGKSDLDECIEKKELPNYNIKGLNVQLLQNEKTHYYTKTRLVEERAVRQYIGGGGKYIRGGLSESHGELREIDSGELVLTNQRLIFNGTKRKIEYNLSKIIVVEEHTDAVGIGASNKSKTQFYVISEPHKCAEYIKFAISLYQESTDTKKGKTKSESKAIEILKERYAKGEITKEQFEQIKIDLSGD